MAAAGHFVRERIPVPCSVPEAGRLILELVSTSRDCEAEPAGPMTFRIIRRYRPTWASATGFLVIPLFVRRTEVCRVAVIEARIGAELLLEGTLDEDLHAAMVQLGRIPEAARVSTFGPRPVPQALSPLPPSAATHPASTDAPHGPSLLPSAPPLRPDVIDLRSPAEPVSAEARRGSARRDEFSELIPPPLLPPHAPPGPSADPVDQPAPPAGPAPSFQPMHAREQHSDNGSNGSSRLPSAFRSPRDAVQPDGVPSPKPDSSADDLGTAAPATVAGRTVARRQRYAVRVDTGEEATLDRLLIIGRAPTRGAQDGHAEVLTVNDPTLSVSKTHLAVEVDDAGLWVTDRNSTNGTWIDDGRGALRPVPAGERTVIAPSARVLIGERVLTFTRLPG